MSRTNASARAAGARFERTCLWCAEPIPPPLPGRGTSVKKFCTSRCRYAAGNAARRVATSVPCSRCGEARTLLHPSLAGDVCRRCAAVDATAAAKTVNTQDPVLRFMAKVRKEADGCWAWTGTRQRNGYGAFGIAGGMVRAHRWSYEHFVGPISTGLQIDHLCSVRHCVNPAHLEPVTHAENMRRAKERRAAA